MTAKEILARFDFLYRGAQMVALNREFSYSHDVHHRGEFAEVWRHNHTGIAVAMIHDEVLFLDEEEQIVGRIFHCREAVLVV